MRRLSRHRDAKGLLLAAVLSAGAMVLLSLGGAMLGATESRYFGALFTFLGLLSWGLFLHGPCLLVASAVLLRAARTGLARGCFGAALVLVAVFLQAAVIEPSWLEVKRYEVASSKLRRPLRIVLLADLQTDRVGDYERRVVRAAAREEPDLILFSGDYLQVRAESYSAMSEELNALFVEEGLSAPLGLIAVEGNVDRPSWPNIFAGLGATTFVETGSVDLGELRVTGLSFEDSFETDLRMPASDVFHVVVGHAPDFARGDVRADLLVAGHTHGGQVRLPLLGPLLTLSTVPRSWAAGLTRISTGSDLVVSRGLGMERGDAPRLRFLCRPELSVIDVVPAPKE